MKRYQKKDPQAVVAVQIDLETDGLQYQKWGDTQRAKAGDWLLNNNGSVYTVDQEVFARSYEEVSLGVYRKTAIMHAEPATEDGSIGTLEGRTHYKKGDYLVYEKPGQEEGAYAIRKKAFKEMYEEVVD